MSTRSIIAAYNQDTKSYRSIYCHFDGYPEGVGATLAKHYKDQAKISLLMDLGDLSSLGEEIGEKHDFNDLDDHGWCRAYGRDRGEKGVKGRTHYSFYSLSKEIDNYGCDYLYVWRDETWTCFPAKKLEELEID